MLRNIKDLLNRPVNATDGPIGHVKDFYFDDHAWAIRYLVVETGSWLSSRKVLVTPVSVPDLVWLEDPMTVTITKEQVRHSPGIDADKPVSRQNEADYMGYYGYPPYWGGEGLWGAGVYPGALAPGFTGYRMERSQRVREIESWLRRERARHRNDDPHLRSCEAVTGYKVHASDGDIGHVAGFLIDEETWAIEFIIVDTGHWLPGRKVLMAPDWIAGVHWVDRVVSVNVSRQAVKTAPAYEPDAAWTLEAHQGLYEHYGRPGYRAEAEATL